MKFKAYPKIHRLGKEETDGILETTITIQEKIDGANVSVWLEDGEISGGSRTRKLGDESFNGFVEYIKSKPEIKSWLENNPGKRLYGEWLVRHTIHYNETAYKKMYLFDIYCDETDEYLPQNEVREAAAKMGLEYPQIFAESVSTTLDEIEIYVGKSKIGPQGEGVVLKSDFVNKFGDKAYAKVVTQAFKENNAIVFGGNNKHSETYHEMWVINKYCTISRVRKIMEKLQPEVDKRLDVEHTARIINTAYHDLITEEMWEISKKVPSLNFRQLQRLASRKFVQIYHDILKNNLSVADGGKDESN